MKPLFFVIPLLCWWAAIIIVDNTRSPKSEKAFDIARVLILLGIAAVGCGVLSLFIG